MEGLKTDIKWGQTVIWIEQYIVQLSFFLFGVSNTVEAGVLIRQLLSAPAQGTSAAVAAANILILLLLAGFYFLCVYGIRVRKALVASSDRLEEVVIPFLSTFGFLFYGPVLLSTQKMNVFLIPAGLRMPLLWPGIIVAAAGLFLSCLAVYQLRHSFSVTVQVREVVSSGLYRFVRHPIYSAYTLMEMGLIMISPRLVTVALITMMILLRIYRARLEEDKLARYSPEYRAYQESTPFWVPGISAHFSKSR